MLLFSLRSSFANPPGGTLAEWSKRGGVVHLFVQEDTELPERPDRILPFASCSARNTRLQKQHPQAGPSLSRVTLRECYSRLLQSSGVPHAHIQFLLGYHGPKPEILGQPKRAQRSNAITHHR